MQRQFSFGQVTFNLLLWDVWTHSVCMVAQVLFGEAHSIHLILQVLDLQRNAGNKCFFHITMPLQSGAERLSDMTRYDKIQYYFLQKTDNCKARSRLQSNGCKAKQELQGVDGFSHFSTCCHGSFDPNYSTRILQDSRFLKHCSKWQKDAFQPWIARRRAALSQRFSGQILIGILRLESARVTKSARERVTDPQTTT